MTQEKDSTEYLRKLSIELASIAESGLAYCQNSYDIERLHQVGRLAADLMNRIGDTGSVEYDPRVARTAGYATPKIDVRGGVFNDAGQVLLVQEVADNGRWTVPGGWCDVLDTPTGAVEREVWEEAGLKVEATHLAAVVDRDRWAHKPALDHHIYKLLFVCKPLGALDLAYTSLETSRVGWFNVDQLPELSVGRILPTQIKLLQEHWRNPGLAYVD